MREIAVKNKYNKSKQQKQFMSKIKSSRFYRHAEENKRADQKK